jgi:serine/threonine protein kinase
MQHDTSARLHEIDRLFAQALELSGDARQVWLRELTSRDAEAAVRVAELLRAAETPTGAAFEGQLVSLVSSLAAAATAAAGNRSDDRIDDQIGGQIDGGIDHRGDDPADDRIGDRFGPYRVVREIARGGMAIVYLAERADGAFAQQVALKVLPLAFADEHARRRLERERQILANLQHPGIARLLDGGADAWGRPFLVMELVEGTPIDRYCDTHRLGLDARLRLLVDAARAVEYAHQNLIVHRDLKPSNVLVTPDGQVKLLDFGIATLLEQDLDAPRTQHSHAQCPRTQRLLTPAYASPEQWRGEPLTAASDAYQLGLMLFELLTGQRFGQRLGERLGVRSGDRPGERPDDHTGEQPTEIFGARPVTPPSAVVADFPRTLEADAIAARAEARGTTHAAWIRRLRDDLDTITCTLLHPDRAARYPSVAAFIDDVARHHAGLPIVARPPTLSYRASRFVRRHRVRVGAAVVALLAMVGGTTAALWQASAARQARDRTLTEAVRAQRVADFLTDVFAISNAERTRGRDTSARDLLDRAARRVDQELTGEPSLQADMMDAVGHAYHNLGFYDEADTLLRRALTARRMQSPQDHKAIASLEHHLGQLLYDRGEPAEAERHLTDALTLRRAIYGPLHPSIADTIHALGCVAHCRGQLDESERLLREALAMRRGLLGVSDPAVAATLNELARLSIRKRRFAEAEQFAREALEIRRRVLGPRHPSVAASLDMLGMVRHNLDDYAGAERLYREALEVRQQTLGASHPDTLVVSNNLGSVLYDHEDYAGARRAYRDALDRSRVRLGNRHPMVAQYLFNLSRSAYELSRGAEAEQALRESLAIREGVYGERHRQTAAALAQLAIVLRDRGAYEEARRFFDRSLRICRSLQDDNRTLMTTVLLHYGALLIDLGRAADAANAAAMIEEGLALRRAEYGETSWRTAEAKTIAAALRLAQGHRDQALAIWAQAVPILKKERPALRATRRAIERWNAAATEDAAAAAAGASP